MPSKMDAEFHGRVKAITLLLQAELAQLHMRFQREQEQIVAEWMERIRNSLRALTVDHGGNGDGLAVSGR